MRKVVIRQSNPGPGNASAERLVGLLATGLQRLFEKEASIAAKAVDFDADESVTTSCPNDGAGEDRAT